MTDGGRPGREPRRSSPSPPVRHPLLWALVAYLVLAPALVAWQFGKEYERVDWSQDDEKHYLEIASGWEEGSGLRGLGEVFVDGTRERWLLRPYLWTSWAVWYRIWQDDAKAYALVSFVLHVLNGAIVLLLIDAFLGATAPRRTEEPDRWSRAGPALAGALVFVAHPGHSKTLGWLAAQEDIIHGVFYLTVLYGLVRWLRDPDDRRAYVLSIVAGVVGIFSKELISTVGIVAVLWGALLAGSFATFRRQLAWLVPYLLISAGPLLARAVIIHPGPVFSEGTWDEIVRAVCNQFNNPYLDCPADREGIRDGWEIVRKLAVEIPVGIFGFAGRYWALAVVGALVAVGARRARTVKPAIMAAGVVWIYHLPVLQELSWDRPPDRIHWYVPIAALSVLLAWSVRAAIRGRGHGETEAQVDAA